MIVMDSVYESRKNKLISIIDDQFGGNQADFSRHVSIKPSQVNRWLSTDASKIPSICEKSARSIELKCGKPMYWLDGVHAERTPSSLLNLLDEIIESGAVAATLIVTFPGGRQWKLTGQSPEIDASFQAQTQQD